MTKARAVARKTRSVHSLAALFDAFEQPTPLEGLEVIVEALPGSPRRLARPAAESGSARAVRSVRARTAKGCGDGFRLVDDLERVGEHSRRETDK